MIQLTITATHKSYHPSDHYHILGERKKLFPCIATAKGWLKDWYGKCKRTKVFQNVEGVAVHNGWTFGYRNTDLSVIPPEKWLQQDWVTFDRIVLVDLGKEK